MHMHLCVYTRAHAHPLCGTADELALNGINSINKLAALETFFDISELTLEFFFFGR